MTVINCEHTQKKRGAPPKKFHLPSLAWGEESFCRIFSETSNESNVFFLLCSANGGDAMWWAHLLTCTVPALLYLSLYLCICICTMYIHIDIPTCTVPSLLHLLLYSCICILYFTHRPTLCLCSAPPIALFTPIFADPCDRSEVIHQILGDLHIIWSYCHTHRSHRSLSYCQTHCLTVTHTVLLSNTLSYCQTHCLTVTHIVLMSHTHCLTVKHTDLL